MFYKLFEEWTLGGRPALLKANGKAADGWPPVSAARAGLARHLRLLQGKEE